MTLDCTLVTDGSSDTVLLPVLRWLFPTLTEEPVEVRWADLRGLRRPPRGLEDRLRVAVELYPCRLLLVHRDAEREASDLRYAEIATANRTGLTHVCVVPVRMQEAWLLHDEASVRTAAGRPSGVDPLSLPPPSKWEAVSDPKVILHNALIAASGAAGRRAKRFNPSSAAHRLADLIEDWSPLRNLGAFQRLERDLRRTLSELGLPVNLEG